MTVQTLHPKHFDQGSIIAQTQHPGFEHHCHTVPDLLQITAQEGAALLLRSLRDGDFTLPGNAKITARDEALRHAPKIVPEDRHIDWATWTADEIMLRHRVIGPLWNILYARGAPPTSKRLIWSSGFQPSEFDAPSSIEAGHLFTVEYNETPPATFARTCDGKVLQIDQVTFEGQSSSDPVSGSKQAGYFVGDLIADMPDVREASQLKNLWNGDLR